MDVYGRKQRGSKRRVEWRNGALDKGVPVERGSSEKRKGMVEMGEKGLEMVEEWRRTGASYSSLGHTSSQPNPTYEAPIFLSACNGSK